MAHRRHPLRKKPASDRYEKETLDQGSQIIAARLPVGTANAQGRRYLIHTAVRAKLDLIVVVARKPVDSVDFRVTLHRRTLSIELEGKAASASAETDAIPPPLGAEVHFLAAIEQRVASLSGEFQSIYLAGGVTRISARFPMESTVLPG